MHPVCIFWPSSYSSPGRRQPELIRSFSPPRAPTIGQFRDADYVSRKDGTPWQADLMDGHLDYVSGCDSCHTGSFDFGRVWLNSSDRSSRPKSCVGCHGRDEDVNGSCTGLSPALDGIEAECGSAAGLRRHHEQAVSTGICSGCHSGDPTSVVGENVVPFNYGMSGVGPVDPCNADGTESRFGPTGLDNDGDLADDLADTDCMPAVDSDGDGVADSIDNCTDVANASQRDTNNDNIGNNCDADINNDCTINFVDLNVYRANFFQAGDLDTDNNGDGQTNFVDLNIVRASFFGPPGPSAAGCN